MAWGENAEKMVKHKKNAGTWLTQDPGKGKWGV